MRRKMKMLLMLCLLLAPVAYGQDTDELCAKVAGLAGTVMEERQAGVDAVEMYEWAAGANPSIQDMLRDMVTEAYSQPRYSTPDYQRNAVSDFKSRVMVECMRD